MTHTNTLIAEINTNRQIDIIRQEMYEFDYR